MKFFLLFILFYLLGCANYGTGLSRDQASQWGECRGIDGCLHDSTCHKGHVDCTEKKVCKIKDWMKMQHGACIKQGGEFRLKK